MTGRSARLTPDKRDATDRARALMHGIFIGRDPGARRRRAHVLGLPHRHRGHRHRALRPQARHGPAVLGRGPPLRDLGQALGLDGHRDRRVLGEHRAVRSGVQPRSRAAPRRREPRPRRPRHRRVHHDEGVRRPRRRPVPRVLRGLDAGRRGHPREDGLRLAAPPHRERPRSAARRPSSSRASSTSCSPSAAPRSDSDESPIGLARRFRELAGFTGEEIAEIAELSNSALDDAKASRRQLREQADGPHHRRVRRLSVPVTVTPDAFTLVAFDAATIHRLATDLLDRLGVADWDVLVEVDETTPRRPRHRRARLAPGPAGRERRPRRTPGGPASSPRKR